MDVENMLEADDKFDSIIKMEGNYFIMDSEQLVANPFQEMQQDAAQEAQKKSSMTERLTSVKNNVCENHFQMAKGRLDRQKSQRLKQLHDNSNKLRHEVKLLDLDRQRHNVEIKKRLMPERDFSYDDMQIVNTEKRLGANIASFYLDKKLKYPTRLRSVSDISVTPTIRKARASIREQQVKKSLDDYAPTMGSRQLLDRAATAKTTASSATATTLPKGAAARASLARRRDSRSAPVYYNARNSRYGQSDSATTLPAIGQEGGGTRRRQRDAWTSKSGSNNNSNVQYQQQSGSSQHVKFVFENPLKILASSEESANLFAKSHPYYPGLVRAVNFGSDDSDEDDDDPYPSTEVIDLRSILFGKGNGGDSGGGGRAASQPMSLTHQQMAAIRKAQGPPPKLTTDMKQEETNYINSKINAFLENLAMARVRTRRDSDDDIFADLDSGETTATQDAGADWAPKFQSKSTSTAMTTTKEDANGDNDPNTKSTSTADFFGQRADTDNALQHGTPAEHASKPSTSGNPFKNSSNSSSNKENNGNAAVSNNKTSTDNNNRTSFLNNTKSADDTTNAKNDPETKTSEEEEEPTAHAGTPRHTKYSWRCIRGRQPDGELRGSYSSEDLVLQSLTGVPISNMLSGHVPLHSASRAMRHTATFKMHKIVEKLIHERTKYERHQVEELKRKMETEEPPSPPLGGSNNTSQPTRKTSNPSIGSRRTSQILAK